MSVNLDFGDDRPGQPSEQVATNHGWTQVIEWAAGHEPDTYPALFGLLQHGVSEDLDAIATEIGDILENEPPASDVGDTLQGVKRSIEANRDEGIAVVSSQYQSGDEAGESED